MAEPLFDSLRDRLIVFDHHGTVVKANRVAFDELAGELVLGGACPGLGSNCNVDAGGCIAAAARDRGVPIVGSCIRTDTRTGRVYAVDAYPVPAMDERGPLVIESARDITDSQQAEARARHQEKFAALGMLAAGIAHDIGNPLASISSELEMMELEHDVRHLHESVGVLRRQIARVSNTLREMTDFARRRGEESSLVPVKLAVDDALRMVRHDPRARKTNIVVDLPADLPPIPIVEDHLVIVLVNVCINAFDAMPNGGELKLMAREQDASIVLSICDTGVGMSEEVRLRAAEPLFTTKQGRGGTGLGLSVSADIVRRSGGRLEVRSVQSRGTTIELTFPVSTSKRLAPVLDGVAHD